MSPKDIPVLIPRTYKYVTLHSKIDFAGVTKLKILRWKDYAGLFRWAQGNDTGPHKREARKSVTEGDMAM